MCDKLQVSEGGYYAWRKRSESERQLEDNRLKELIKQFFDKLKGNPGRRRIHAELEAHGWRLSIKRVHRLMTELSLVGRHPRAWRKTTVAGDRKNYAKDLIGRNFTAKNPNVKWCGDITYIKTGDGWAYLATVIDLHNREVVGWAIADHMRTDLVEDALKMAIGKRKPKRKVIFHSDRGTQYTSDQFVKFCKNNNITRSMGRTGVCFDNAVAESFFATYKKELIFTKPWTSIRQLRRETFEWIEEYYNRKRRHSALGYLTPHEYMLGYRSLGEIYSKVV
jgi:transposase InsO family protein